MSECVCVDGCTPETYVCVCGGGGVWGGEHFLLPQA